MIYLYSYVLSLSDFTNEQRTMGKMSGFWLPEWQIKTVCFWAAESVSDLKKFHFVEKVDIKILKSAYKSW